jgi:hypothetical protein
MCRVQQKFIDIFNTFDTFFLRLPQSNEGAGKTRCPLLECDRAPQKNFRL